MLKEHRTEGNEGTREEDRPLPHHVLTGTVLKCVVIPENCHAGVGQSRKSKLKSVNDVESVWSIPVAHVLPNASMRFSCVDPVSWCVGGNQSPAGAELTLILGLHSSLWLPHMTLHNQPHFVLSFSHPGTHPSSSLHCMR